MGNVKFEIHDDPSEILDKLIEKPRLCMLLNIELTKGQLAMLYNTFCIVEIEYEGQMRQAIVCGFYQLSADEVVEPQVYDIWEEK